MAVSVRSLRRGVVALAVLLVAVLVGYIGYAKRRAQSFLHDLPGRMGIDITQTTDNFTYSQSLKGKTVFTVHAAKEIQHRNGVITLRDVGILLYGANGTRADRIHGQEFEYDQKAGTLRAVGEALIDLGPPGDAVADEQHMIHVKASGLVFQQAEGTAETPEAVSFAANGLVGEAVGAAYNSKTNVLVLQSAVKVSGLRGQGGKERPMVLTAARAEMDRAENTVLLAGPNYVSATDAGAQSVSAAQAVVHTTAEGKPKDVEAQGRVRLTGEGRGTVFAERLDMTLNGEGQPRDSHLYGGVRFVNESQTRQEGGRAQDVTVAFDGEGRARTARMVGAVELNEAAGVSRRRLEAEQVDLSFTGGGKQKLALNGATAGGNSGARLHMVEAKADGGQGTTATGLRANTLTGRFDGEELIGLDGFWETLVERDVYDAKGRQLARETSTGDRLNVELKPAAKGRMELARAVQKGSVAIVREAAATKAGAAAAEVEHARADQGDYEADEDSLTLAGTAQVSDVTSAVYANWIKLFRATGDAQADGAVRVSYTEGRPGSEPVHVLAATAMAHRATGVTEFTAAPGGKVRMWQGGSQVEAPVLDLDRTKKELTAHGVGPTDADAVRTLLVSETGGKPGAKPQPPVRVVSDRMLYTDATRQVDFAGRVQVAQTAGTLHAEDAIVYLAPAAAAGAVPDPAQTFFGGGKVERVVGTGAVELQEPGRRAVGEKILYTAADETYVLTGTQAAPPRLTDEARGTVTGAQLRFKRGDESVEVVGGEGGRVRSEPRGKP